MLKEAFLKGFFSRHGIESLGKRDMGALLRSARDRGSSTDSLFLLPVKYLTKKIVGKHKFERMGSRFNKAIFDVDTALGKPLDIAASKLSLTKNLFKQEELAPMGKGMYKKIVRPSLLAPVDSLSKLVMPMVASSAIYSKLKKKEHEQEGKQ